MHADRAATSNEQAVTPFGWLWAVLVGVVLVVNAVGLVAIAAGRFG